MRSYHVDKNDNSILYDTSRKLDFRKTSDNIFTLKTTGFTYKIEVTNLFVNFEIFYTDVNVGVTARHAFVKDVIAILGKDFTFSNELIKTTHDGEKFIMTAVHYNEQFAS